MIELGPIQLCLNPAECPDKQSHVRVGNEIHHCKGGPDGCECLVCVNLFWGATCGDERVREYIGGKKDALEYDGSDNPSPLDLL